MANTSGKVTVSREVAEAIDYLTGSDNEETAIRYHAQGNQHVADLSSLNGLPLDTLIRALYIGYEVEKSPEEELAEYIQNNVENLRNNPFGVDSDYYNGRVEGARKAAEILGVTLPEGVR